MLRSFVTFYGWEPVFWFWSSMASSFALGWILAKVKRKALAGSWALLVLLGMLWWLY